MVITEARVGGSWRICFREPNVYEDLQIEMINDHHWWWKWWWWGRWENVPRKSPSWQLMRGYTCHEQMQYNAYNAIQCLQCNTGNTSEATHLRPGFQPAFSMPTIHFNAMFTTNNAMCCNAIQKHSHCKAIVYSPVWSTWPLWTVRCGWKIHKYIFSW